MTQYLAPVSWSFSTNLSFVKDSSHLMMLPAAGYRLLLRARDTEGVRPYFSLLRELWGSQLSHFFRMRGFGCGDCGSEVVVVGAELFLLEGMLIGVCSLSTSIQVLGSHPARGLCSTRRPNSKPPRRVALGFILISVHDSDVCVGGGAEQKVGNGSGTSRSVR